MKLSIIHLVLGLALAVSSGAYAACNVSIPLSKSDGIYADHGDGTVTDAETGLMWQKCSLGLSGATCATGTASTYTWKAALDAAQTANGGAGTFAYTDWRLPSVEESGSLIDRACASPAINTILFPGTVSGGYWTSTPNGGASTAAWFLDFAHGSVNGNAKNTAYYVRLVRGGY